METPVGNIMISASTDKIERISFVDVPCDSIETFNLSPAIRMIVDQIREYFNGKRKRFDVDLEFSTGTEFQKSVWKATMQIPYGEVRTYSQIAKQIGNPQAYRAVANSLAANPLVLIVPCHRVVSKKGIGGFSAGVWRKEWLLNFEKMEEDKS